MATLNKEVKKLPSEQNLRLLSSLIVSIANKQSSLEDKCIAPWKADETYQKDVSYVSYNGYIYICSVTNQDSVFTESHWIKLSDDITELSKSDVEAMLNLSQEELDNLQKLLKDDQITTTSTHSSSKIYSDIQAAIETAKEYTNEQTGKCVKPAYKVVASTSDITETGYFYLISNGTNYDMYVLSADGSVVSLGTSDVDLSDYAKLTDLDSYYDKATSDGKFATITTLNTHIGDNTIHITQDEKDKLVTTDDITDTIDINSSDTKIPNVKAIYNDVIEGKNIDQTAIDTCGTEILKYPLGIWRIGSDNIANNFADLPVKTSGRIEITSIDANTNKNPWNNSWSYRAYNFETYTGMNYFRKVTSATTAGNISTDTGWQKVCTTSVADITGFATQLDTQNYYNIMDGSYVVINGICYVQRICVDCVTPAGYYTEIGTGYPKPKSTGNHFELKSSMNINSNDILGYIRQDGCIMLMCGTSGATDYFGSIQYPVAES